MLEVKKLKRFVVFTGEDNSQWDRYVNVIRRHYDNTSLNPDIFEYPEAMSHVKDFGKRIEYYITCRKKAPNIVIKTFSNDFIKEMLKCPSIRNNSTFIITHNDKSFTTMDGHLAYDLIHKGNDITFESSYPQSPLSVRQALLAEQLVAIVKSHGSLEDKVAKIVEAWRE